MTIGEQQSFDRQIAAGREQAIRVIKRFYNRWKVVDA